MQNDLHAGNFHAPADPRVRGHDPLCVGRISLTAHDGLVVRGDEAQIEEVNARTAAWGAPPTGGGAPAGAVSGDVDADTAGDSGSTMIPLQAVDPADRGGAGG